MFSRQVLIGRGESMIRINFSSGALTVPHYSPTYHPILLATPIFRESTLKELLLDVEVIQLLRRLTPA